MVILANMVSIYLQELMFSPFKDFSLERATEVKANQ